MIYPNSVNILIIFWLSLSVMAISSFFYSAEGIDPSIALKMFNKVIWSSH